MYKFKINLKLLEVGCSVLSPTVDLVLARCLEARMCSYQTMLCFVEKINLGSMYDFINDQFPNPFILRYKDI